MAALATAFIVSMRSTSRFRSEVTDRCATATERALVRRTGDRCPTPDLPEPVVDVLVPPFEGWSRAVEAGAERFQFDLVHRPDCVGEVGRESFDPCWVVDDRAHRLIVEPLEHPDHTVVDQGEVHQSGHRYPGGRREAMRSSG